MMFFVGGAVLLQSCFAWVPSTAATAAIMRTSSESLSPRQLFFKKQISVVLSSTKRDNMEVQDHNNDEPPEEFNKNLVKSVNYFISRKCNYACQFCFHTAKTSHHLAVAQATIGLELLRDAGMFVCLFYCIFEWHVRM